MHADEVPIDAALVARLLREQHPRWAALPLTRVASAGTDHAIFRLGAELAVRLPRHPGAAAQVAKEQRWLPHLAPALPLPVPVPVAAGAPAAGFPFAWSVCRWVEGAPPKEPTPAIARALAAFILALRRCDASEAPAPGPHNFGRGVALASRDAATRAAIATLPYALDALWDDALSAPAWTGPPTWLHGDLAPGNMLVRDGQLAAVLDFGGLAAGDPACDLAVAWSFFRGASRQAFHEALQPDPDSWARGRGWALSIAAIQLPYYQDRNPTLAESARRTLAELMDDRQASHEGPLPC